MTVKFETISEAVAKIGKIAPDRGYVFQDLKGKESTLLFPEVEVQTAVRAAALQALGLQKGDRIALVIVEPEAFVLTFLAALRVGVVPVPLYPPLSFGSLDAYAERTARVLEQSGSRVVVASASLQNVLWELVDRVTTLERLVTVEALSECNTAPSWPEIKPDDLAFLQYTSGSTADPKGVIVTHRNLVANCSAMVKRLDVRPEAGDKAISWLPLYHDMGLIGFVLTTILFGVPTVFIPTMRFIKKPTVWLDVMHAHKGTLSFGPNFAYALVAKKAHPADLARWDLSHVRVLGCGAEPIHPETVREFLATFRACGLKEEAFLSSYGMAESTLAISFKPLAEKMITKRVDAAQFQHDGHVVPEKDGGAVFEHVSCGTLFDGHALAVRGEDGTELPEGVEGELCLHGPSVTPGYFGNPEATAAVLSEGWLRTGDLGYLLGGHVYVTGRLKDLIILNGRNIHPQAIEWVCAKTEGVRKGNVVAFSRPGAHSEELVVALETRAEDTALLVANVKAAVQREHGITIADVVCLEPGMLPKTSSGKLQRRKTRQQYLEGKLGRDGSRLAGATGDRITLARHVVRSVWSRAKAAVLSRSPSGVEK